MGCCLSNFLSFAGMFAWITSCSALLVDQLGMNPQSFGFWSGLTGSGLMVGAFLNGSLVKKLGSKAMLYAGWFLIISSGAFLLATSFLESNLIPMILISAFVFFLGSAFIYTNTNALAFSLW